MKRVLFVDDEAPVLDGLRARLHRATPWDMVFAVGAEKALQQLESQHFDVIVSDLRMPNVNGAQLLHTVSERWPETVRIILSGCSEADQALHLVPVAHQFLSKPCEAQQLRNRIERALQLHEYLSSPKLRAAVGRIRTLPAIPRTYAQLQKVMTREDASAADVAQVISADPVVAGKLLQIANSAFFRLAKRITRIDQAVSYLGFTTVRNLVLSVEIFDQWRLQPQHAALLEKLQAHSHKVTLAVEALTSGTPLREDATVAALLHDIGYWILLQTMPDDLQRSVELAIAKNIALHEAEQQLLGTSHAQIGAYLLGLWGIPYSIVEAVAHHHTPEAVQPQEFDVLTALALAEAFVDEGDATVFDLPRNADLGVYTSKLRALPAPFGWDEAQARVREAVGSGDGVS